MAESKTDINFEVEHQKEQERLAKLWDAYDEQVGIINEHEKKEKELKKEVEEKDTTIENLEELLSTRDKRIREMEKELNLLRKSDAKSKPVKEQLESQIDEEREKVVKIFEISQELQDELNLAKDALLVRDAWFVDNVQVLEKMAEILEERKAILQGDFKVYMARAKEMVGDDEKKADTKEEAPEEEKKELGKDEAVELFVKIDGIDEELAADIWEELAKDLDTFLSLKKLDLIKIDQVLPTMADKIVKGIKAYKKA